MQCFRADYYHISQIWPEYWKNVIWKKKKKKKRKEAVTCKYRGYNYLPTHFQTHVTVEQIRRVFCDISLRRGDSNEYPQYMFYGELTKIILELSSNIHFICSTDVNATFYPCGYILTRGKHLTPELNLPTCVNFMHVNDTWEIKLFSFVLPFLFIVILQTTLFYTISELNVINNNTYHNCYYCLFTGQE